MSVVPKIAKSLSTFSGKPLGVISKALGAATCAALLYDAHYNGKETAKNRDTMDSADRFEKEFKQYMTCDKESATLCKFKKDWFDSQLTLSCPHIFSRVGGYLGGFSSTLLAHLPLIALSAVSIKCKTLGKVAGTVLAANGVKTYMYDVLGKGSRAKD